MTSWTKVTDSSTDYKGGDIDYRMLSEDEAYILTEDGEYIVAEGPSTSFTDVSDIVSQWAPFGGLLYLATEGGDILANEDESTYLVVSKGSDGVTYTDVADQSTSWTKVSDA
jgi:hypothetical protein